MWIKIGMTRWFDFGGETYVNTNKYIRLTQDRQSETGWLWSRLPITVPNFQIDIEFKISSSSNHLFGDGMAIWITKGRAQYGPVFGSADQFEGIGIFIDTYSNTRHSYSFPRILGMIGDGKQRYDQGSDGDTNAAGACSARVRRTKKDQVKTIARIIYKKDQGLEVLIQYKGWDEWTPCFELKGMTLPASPYLGVTAITGEVYEAHDVVSITTSSIITRRPEIAGKVAPPEPVKAKIPSGGGFLSFLLKVSLFGGFCAAAYQAYRVYYLQNGRWSNKRF